MPVFESQKLLADTAHKIKSEHDGVFGVVNMHDGEKYHTFIHGVSISDMADVFESSINDMDSKIGQAIRLAFARQLGRRQVRDLLN